MQRVFSIRFIVEELRKEHQHKDIKKKGKKEGDVIQVIHHWA